MTRNVFILLIVLATGLYAWEPPLPVTLKVDAQEPVGYNSTFKATVSIGLRSDVVKQNIEAGDVRLKIYLPPAMDLIEGDLEWQGVLVPGETETFELLVKPTLAKPLLWDIGAAVTSSLLERARIDVISIYIEESRGVALYDIHKQIEEEPWLKEALGFRDVLVIEDGVEKTVTAPFVDHLQSQKDFELMPKQEARPNKLYQKEWLDYFKPYAISQDVSPKKKKKSGISTKLASGCIYYGNVVSIDTALYDAKVHLYLYGSPVQSTYTVGTGYYSFYYDCPEYPGQVTICVELRDHYGDKVCHPGTDNVWYAFDETKEKDGDIYNFGIFDLNDLGNTYGMAGKCFYELEYVRHYQSYSGLDPCVCRYPEEMGDTAAKYITCCDRMKIAENQWLSVSHEWGHHIHVNKGVIPNSCGYHWYCGPLHDCKGIGFAEGFADSQRDRRLGVSRENETCLTPTLKLAKKCRAAYYDLRDLGDDGEDCRLSWSEIISGFQSGQEDILDHFNRLKILNPADSAEIQNVIDANTLYDYYLLAAAGDPASLSFEPVDKDLLQNEPNPFNPSTSISFTLAGEDAIEVSLTVFDVRGRTVRKLISGSRNPGKHTVFWNGRDDYGKPVSSGVYFYRLLVGGYVKTRKMVIIK